jgi:triosephosphate isomerase (TIM)
LTSISPSFDSSYWLFSSGFESAVFPETIFLPMPRRKFVAGNWKMHGSTAANGALVAALRTANLGTGCEVAVCPPALFLVPIGTALQGSGIRLGAQTLSEHDSGAYTGECAGAMLAETGCSIVLVGHSERRALFGESDAAVAAKFIAAQRHKLVPVLCVGETLAERESGQTEAVVGRQLDVVLQKAGVAAFAQAVIAYEPVWAIGTGKTASPEQAQAVHAFIRARVAGLDATIGAAVRIVYGGSVKASNAAALFACADIDGGLVGGASLVADEFIAICKAAGG